MKTIYIFIASLLLVTTQLAYSHEGDKDSSNCHIDQIKKTQHCHLAGKSSNTYLNLCNFDKGDYPRFKNKHYGGWIDADGNRLNTREEVLKAESLSPTVTEDRRRKRKGKKVVSGYWYDLYIGKEFDNPRKVFVDHLVPLKEAHISGAWQWSDEKKRRYANDLRNDATLIVVSKKSHKRKKNRDPAEWLPSNDEYICQYIDDWIKVKSAWKLCYNKDEINAIRNEKLKC